MTLHLKAILCSNVLNTSHYKKTELQWRSSARQKKTAAKGDTLKIAF